MNKLDANTSPTKDTGMAFRIAVNGACMLMAALMLAGGCATPYYEPAPPEPPPSAYRRIVKPVLAVTDFENKSGFSGAWNLGGGMSDVLVNSLLTDEKVVVLERRHLRDVVSELDLQKSDLFREEGRVSRGRLKTASYLVRGAVTDFTITRDQSGWFSVEGKGRLFGRGQKARVTLHAMLIDIENGEVIGAVKGTGSAGSSLFGGSFNYKKVNFGGESFFRTPLGKATGEAMDDVVRQLYRLIPVTWWQPMVAQADAQKVILNGGQNVGIEPGTQFMVMGESVVITDPLTGEVIERNRGPVKGRIMVTSVNQASSLARLIEGRAGRGDPLVPIAVK